MNMQKNAMFISILIILFLSMCFATESSDTNVSFNTSQRITNVVDLVTKNGVKYKNVTILRAEADALVIQHSSGIEGVPFSEVPDALQKQYGYDPVNAISKKRQQAEAEVVQRACLEGKDLVAWKVAKQAAEEKCKELSAPHHMRVPYQAATSGSAAAYAIQANAQLAAQQPTYVVVAEPQRRFMAKSDANDWTFIIPVKALYYDIKKKIQVPTWERMRVKVTNYGLELRVAEVQLDSK